ncbi:MULTISPECIES: AAA-like domain-containing protein [Methylotenera]|uniref:AAA-like domain-containing protein n=1 Tax=Methylotenera TaxID=359407 RepID=UPI0003736286|nr:MULTISPECIES: AAA-like domain-containing protein [Methylotenera]
MNTPIKSTDTKVLKSYTIVPQSLYVARQADRQLRKILEDKGRPGYVLVSRQMGKTNLLLNARREFKSFTNHFIYLDISNNFPDLSSFFRNIIDVAIDNMSAESHALRIQIDLLRSEGLFSSYPHKEHEQELRYLLSIINGSITICLDEIDAIIKTNYSDAVFSFIRSVYFSGRVNFPEFERLNYVLSGVAEPSELIKDKASSPFNIGEKIYLDDFSFEEFEEFIENANITINNQSRDRVFYWTNGNPRLTWDVLSKIEDCILENIDITTSKIDEIVKINYLSSFDLPPIDHIRNLAEEDPEVRSCLISLHYSKSDGLTDQQKSKLYLAGIISSSITSAVPKIKNRIIAESLSESWLKEIDNSKLSTLERANKFYESKQFSDAVLYFEEYIASLADHSSVDSIVYHKIGFSYYELNQFEDAEDNFSKNPFKDNNLELFLLQTYWRGMCSFFREDFISSIGFFKLVIQKSNEAHNYKLYYDAHTNLSSAMFRSSKASYEEILEITNNVLKTSSENIQKQADKSSRHVTNLYCVCNINLFKIALLQGLNESALAHISEAIKFADEHAKVGLILDQIDAQLSTKSDVEFLDELIAYIYDNNLRIVEKSIKYPNAFDYEKVVKLVTHLNRLGQQSKIKDLIIYLSDSKFNHEENIFDLLTSACFELIPKNRVNDFLELSKLVITFSQELTEKTVLKDLVGLRILFDEKNASTITEYDNFYTDNFWSEDEEIVEESASQLGDIDYKVLEIITHKLRSNNKHLEAVELISKFKQFKSSDLIIIDDYPLSVTKNIVVTARELMASMPLLNEESIFNQAEYLNSLFTMNYSNELLYFNQKILDDIKSFNNRILYDFKKIKTIRNEHPKYGRNQIISVISKNGIVSKGKFKNLKDKIDSGEYKVID